MPARSGDCTSVRKRVSRSWGSTGRAAAGALARRALKVKSSIYLRRLSADGARLDRAAPGGAAAAVMVGLVALDQVLHPRGVALAVPVAEDRIRSAARLDEHVRQDEPRVDLHRRDVRHVDRFLLSAD